MSEIQVYKPGTPVLINDEVPGTVHEVLIADGRLQYRVSWWDGRVRKTEWLEWFELMPASGSKRKRVGFKSQ